MKTKFDEEIKDYASVLSDGDTANSLVCPCCNGGSSHDRSFCVTKEDSLIKYICFRASCGYRGILGDNPNNPREAPKKRSVMPYRRRTQDLSDTDKNILLGKFEICPSEWRWGIDDCRVIMPITDHRGYVIGHVARNYEELSGMYSKAKSIAYWEDANYAKLHFCTYTNADWLYLVEDIVSAEKVGEFVDCAALLGTNLSDELVAHIISLGYKKVVLWLDDDAFMKACKLSDRYGLAFPQGVSVVHTTSDPKDMPFEEIEEIVIGG